TPEPMPSGGRVATKERFETGSRGLDTRAPSSLAARPPEEARFVIQEHHARRLHFDLRLERDGVLKSWAVPKGVPETSGTNHLAVQTEDHPIEYLTFAGTIPSGEYGAGSMTVWDTGTYDAEKWRDDEVIFTLDGATGGPLGRVRLALIRTDGSGEKSSWLLHRMKEQGAASSGLRSDEGASRNPSQRGTGFRDGAGAPPQPPKGPVPEKPMLATGGTLGMLRGGDWALEWKWDGIRALARVEGGVVRLRSRNGIDVTARYPELHRLPEIVDGDALLDGEIVALDEAGRPSFGVLQQRMGLTKPREIAAVAASVPVRLLLFDVLEAGGEPLVDDPYRTRRARLEALVHPRRGIPVEVPALADGEPEAVLEESRLLGLEGVMAKRTDSTYRPGARSDDWLKLKLTRTQEVVIGGYRRGVGTREGRIRSLLVGIPGEAGLEYAGRVGSGFRERDLDRLLERLDGLTQPSSPFVEVPATDVRDAVWVRPELVGEIEFGEWTGTGVARHPRWRGLRPDKTPADVQREV
ncbi:MAG TPA: non-homologous end-joining DNA ligase, partial [Agromyces sp.]